MTGERSEEQPQSELPITADKIKSRVMILICDGGIDLDKKSESTIGRFTYKTRLYVNGDGLNCTDNVVLDDGAPTATRERTFDKEGKLVSARHALRRSLQNETNQFLHLQLREEFRNQPTPELITYSNQQYSEVSLEKFDKDQASVIAKFLGI